MILELLERERWILASAYSYESVLLAERKDKSSSCSYSPLWPLRFFHEQVRNSWSQRNCERMSRCEGWGSFMSKELKCCAHEMANSKYSYDMQYSMFSIGPLRKHDTTELISKHVFPWACLKQCWEKGSMPSSRIASIHNFGLSWVCGGTSPAIDLQLGGCAIQGFGTKPELLEFPACWAGCNCAKCMCTWCCYSIQYAKRILT